MDYIDKVARIAALEALDQAIEIIKASPELSAAERSAVLNGQLAMARRDYLSSYEVADANESFKHAVFAVCDEIKSGSFSEPASNDLSVDQAAKLLIRQRQ